MMLGTTSRSTVRLERFLAALPEEHRGAPVDLTALDAALATAIATARARWPELELPEPTFVAHLASRVPAGPPLVDAVAHLHVADLWLACACAHGVPGALRAFESTHFGDVDLALARGGDRVRADEVKSVLRERLYLASGARPPRLASYAGRGSLRTWMRVTITNALRDLRDAEQRREVPAEPDEVADFADGTPDPEVLHWKVRCRGELERAFGAALATLPPRDRRILQAALVEHASIDVLARRHRVHRATVARWLERARDALRARMRKLVCERLRLTPREYDSLVGHLRSQVELRL